MLRIGSAQCLELLSADGTGLLHKNSLPAFQKGDSHGRMQIMGSADMYHIQIHVTELLPVRLNDAILGHIFVAGKILRTLCL